MMIDIDHIYYDAVSCVHVTELLQKLASLLMGLTFRLLVDHADFNS